MRIFLCPLLALLAVTAQAAPDGKFVGAFPMQFSEHAWEPNLNNVPVGDITEDAVYADYSFTLADDAQFELLHGNSFAFGCQTNQVVESFFLLEVDGAGNPLSRTEVTGKVVAAEKGKAYVVREVVSNLKACQGYGTSFMALRK